MLALGYNAAIYRERIAIRSFSNHNGRLPGNKAAKLDPIEVFGQNSPMEGNNWRDLAQDQKGDIERIRNDGEAHLAIINEYPGEFAECLK